MPNNKISFQKKIILLIFLIFILMISNFLVIIFTKQISTQNKEAKIENFTQLSSTETSETNQIDDFSYSNQFKTLESVKKEAHLDLSTEYDIFWNNQKLSLFRNNIEIDNFELKEKPLAITVYKPKNVLAIITSQTGNPSDSHNLYLRHDNKTELVYSGKKYDESEGFIINENLYFPHNHKHIPLTFSPDGEKLFANIAFWESNKTLQILTSTGSYKSMDNFETWGSGFDFSPDGNCVVNTNDYGKYDANIFLGKNSANGYIFEKINLNGLNSDDLFMNRNYSDFAVNWKEKCQPLIMHADQNGDKNMYSISDNVLHPEYNTSSFSKSLDSNEYQELIFLTLIEE